MATNFVSPVGRLVQGDPFTPQTKDMQGNPRKTPQYFIGVAYKKTDPQWPAFEAIIRGEAQASFRDFFDDKGNCKHPSFSFKIIDGDGLDGNGKPNSAKEGFAGCWVVRFTSTYPPECYPIDSFTPLMGEGMKKGDFIQVSGNVKGNDNRQKPGVYVNLSKVKLRSVGEEIKTGPDAATIFGDAPENEAPPTFTMTAKANGLTREQYHTLGYTDDRLRAEGLMS